MSHSTQPALLCCKALALAIAVAPVVHAQDSQGVRALEEIVVSARRTEESIQSVPVSITALDSNALRENTITTTEDLQLSIPGVYLAGSGGRQNVIYQIRGQSKALSGTSSPAVVSYFAEVPEPVWGSSVPQFDMASIQVLKGPQGTLFGRNTTGGAILYTPQAPSHEFNGYVSGNIGSYDQRRAQGAINLPLIQDKVALRIAADINNRDGYTKNIATGRDLDDTDTKAFRASLLVEPTDYLSNTTIFDHFKSENNGIGVAVTDVFDGDTLMAQLGIREAAREQIARQKKRGPFKVDSGITGFENSERNSLINRTELDLGGMQLVNIFGYRKTDLNYLINVDGMPTLPADGSGAFPAGTPIKFITGDLYQQTEQYSNELQLRGTAFDDKMEWLVGAFWLKSKPDGYQGNAVAFAAYPGAPVTGSAYNFLTEKSEAVFANIRYSLDAIVEGLQLDVGVRYTEDEIESCLGTGLTGQSNGAELGDCRSGDSSRIVNTSTNSTKSDETTWSIGLNWQVTDDLYTYVVSRRGYRAGGINGPTLEGRLTQFQSFAPETVTDYEIGMRSDWLVGDVVVRANVSAYLGKYEDVQAVLGGVQTSALCDVNAPGGTAPGLSPDGDCNQSNDPAGGTLLVNLGETEVSGADLELVIAPSDYLTFNIGANYIHTETKKIAKPEVLRPYITADEIPFNFTAQKTFLAGARYEMPMDQLAESLVLNLDYYWTDELETGDITMPSYKVTNFRLDLNGVNRTGLDLSLFVRNRFDAEYPLTSVASGRFIGFASSIYGPPRMWGAEARYSF